MPADLYRAHTECRARALLPLLLSAVTKKKREKKSENELSEWADKWQVVSLRGLPGQSRLRPHCWPTTARVIRLEAKVLIKLPVCLLPHCITDSTTDGHWLAPKLTGKIHQFTSSTFLQQKQFYFKREVVHFAESCFKEQSTWDKLSSNQRRWWKKRRLCMLENDEIQFCPSVKQYTLRPTSNDVLSLPPFLCCFCLRIWGAWRLGLFSRCVCVSVCQTVSGELRA